MTSQSTPLYGIQHMSQFLGAVAVIRLQEFGIYEVAKMSKESMLTQVRSSRWTSTNMKISSPLQPLITRSKFGI